MNHPLPSFTDDDISYLRELQKAFEPHQSKWRTLECCIARYTIERELNHEKNLEELKELTETDYEADILERCKAYLG